MSHKVSMVLVLLLGLIVTVAGFNATAQNILDGTWKASLSDNQTKINLNFERQTKPSTESNQKHGKHNFGQTYEFSELQGLTREQVINGGQVSFSMNREAGRIDCVGSFQNSKGTGTFRFTPNAAFVSAMKSRGFDFEETSSRGEPELEDRLFTAAALNVTTALADDLLSANFGKLGVSDLFKAAIFKIDSNFMREMKATGFPDLGMEELVKARIFKIDAAFVAKVADMGFGKQPFESLVKLSIFKVTPEFLNEVRAEGLTNLSIEEAVKLQIFKIDVDFIRKAKADGAPINVEELVRRRIGVARHRAI